MRGLALTAVILLATPACAPAPPPLEPLPAAADALPHVFETMLFENDPGGCRDNDDCASGLCRFEACLALARVDASWEVGVVMDRTRATIATYAAGDPAAGAELERRVVVGLADLLDRGAALAFRARAVEGLEAMGAAGELRARFADLPLPLQEEAALALARLHDPSGLELVLALTESPEPPVVLEALRAIGESHAPADSDALKTLLAELSPELPFEVQEAAVEALGALGDARAEAPLVAYLRTGPEPVAAATAAALRRIAGGDAAFGPDPARWEAWLAAHPAPAPPAYTLKAPAPSPDDLDIPTP